MSSMPRSASDLFRSTVPLRTYLPKSIERTLFRTDAMYVTVSMFPYVMSFRPPTIATNPVVSFVESTARTLSSPARVQPTVRGSRIESHVAPGQTALATSVSCA